MTTPRIVVALLTAIPCAILLLPAVAVAVAFHVFAAGVRGLSRLLEPHFVPWSDLLMFDSAIGWRPKPNLNTHYLASGDDVFKIVTDAEGWPGLQSVESSEMVVVGDSFAFGYGIDTHRSFAQAVNEFSVKAVGAPGYSMVHEMLVMEALGERLRGKLVVWFIFMENDLQDNVLPEMRMYRAPFLRRVRGTGEWEIVKEHVRSERWRCSDLDKRRLFAHMCVPGAIADHAFAACDELLQRGARACRDAGAQLVVLTIPYLPQLTPAGRAQLAAASGRPELCDVELPDRRIAESCRRHGIPMVIGKDHLSAAHYKHREGIHWNEHGHRRVAQLLGDVRSSFAAGTLDHRIPHRSLEARAL